MATISIRPMLGGGLVIGGRVMPVGRLADAAEVRLNVDATKTAATAFHTAMGMVRLCSDTTCFYDIGSAAASNPSASGVLLPANVVDFVEINPRGAILSVVAK